MYLIPAKRIKWIFVCLVFLCFSGCTSLTGKTLETIVINDDNFYDYFLVLNTNPSDLIGREVSIQGKSYISEYNGTTYYLITRCIDGICLEHEWEMIGFEFALDDNETIANDEWINIHGIFSSYEEDGYRYYHILADDIVILPEDGEYFLHNE